MSRIRTIKPEFYIHEGLFDAEMESKFPIRVAFSGLWTCADREGRFEWRPRSLKTKILPYDDVDFSRVLDVLVEKGFIIKYEVNGQIYGYIPNFHRHQNIPAIEPPSEIPWVNGVLTGGQRPPNTTVRNRIYQRDNYTCLNCNDNLKEKPRSICLYQVIKTENGGTHAENNYATYCKKCASIKENSIIEEPNFDIKTGSNSTTVNGGVNRGLTVPLTGCQKILTGGIDIADTERERERERERELEKDIGKGKVQKHMFNSSVVEPQKSLSESFQKFWSTYPRRQAKKKTYDIWKRKKLDKLIDVILEDLAQRTDWNNGSQFTPLPTTYLNGERWQDEEKNERKKQKTKSYLERMEELEKLELEKQMEEQNET